MLRFLQNGGGSSQSLSLLFLLFQCHYQIFPFLEGNIHYIHHFIMQTPRCSNFQIQQCIIIWWPLLHLGYFPAQSCDWSVSIIINCNNLCSRWRRTSSLCQILWRTPSPPPVTLVREDCPSSIHVFQRALWREMRYIISPSYLCFIPETHPQGEGLWRGIQSEPPQLCWPLLLCIKVIYTIHFINPPQW